MKCNFTRIAPDPSDAKLLWRIGSAQAGIVPKRRLGCWCALGIAQRGYEFLIPTSGRRLGITGGRCPTQSFRYSGTHAHEPVMLPHCWMAWYAIVWFFLVGFVYILLLLDYLMYLQELDEDEN